MMVMMVVMMVTKRHKLCYDRGSPLPSTAPSSLGVALVIILYIIYPVAPVAYKVILEPGIGQFREFEPVRVHTRMNSWGLFLVHKLTCGKRESVS